ncbi:MAG: secretion protein [Lysobacteraceae bacterium]|nr:MAG: secretion protein [Xanthomonadaceae bacterium]
MSQNSPPSPPQRPGAEPGPERRDDFDPGADGASANPYYASQQGALPPDLDANAPQLKSNEMQRLNRKALLFLCGIVVLLVLAATWMFSNASAGKEAAAKPREERVVIPELPRNDVAVVESTPPIPVEQYAADPLPPLPAEQYPQAPGPSRQYDAGPQAPRPPTLVERRTMASGGSGSEAGTPAGQPPDPYMQAVLAGMQGNQQAVAPPPDDVSTAQYINRPDGLLVRGTYIRCVLETRIITEIPGFTSCVVTEPVYSINGRSLLLPKGSKISGKYNNAGATGPRVAVVWDRITTPNGIDVNMRSPGVDSLGGAGHPGHYNAHWGSRIASALMISLISDAFSYAAAENGPRTTTISNGNVIETPFESSTARTMERLANQALDRSINRPPTVTINQGTVLNVYVSRDVDFTGVLARN